MQPFTALRRKYVSVCLDSPASCSMHGFVYMQYAKSDQCQWSTSDGKINGLWYMYVLINLSLISSLSLSLSLFLSLSLCFLCFVLFLSTLLQTVFEYLGQALAILITLDTIFCNAPLFSDHWTQYKRFSLLLFFTVTSHFTPDAPAPVLHIVQDCYINSGVSW